MKWIPYGKDAVLVTFAEKPGEWAFRKCRSIVQVLEGKPPANVVEFAPGYTSVLVEFDLGRDGNLSTAADELVKFLQGSVTRKPALGPIRKIPVRYDGPDLERVATHNGIKVEQVVKYHSAVTYKVYLVGFAPGFPYLGELHRKLRTPRLDSPRPKVSPGSVAIGDEHTGIYSVETPGGWNIIGHTDVKVFDPARPEEEAFFLQQGDQVRFLAV